MGEAMDNEDCMDVEEAICERCGERASRCRCGENDDWSG